MKQKVFNSKQQLFPYQSYEHRTHIRKETIKQKIPSSCEILFDSSICIVCDKNDSGPMVVVPWHQRKQLLLKRGVAVCDGARYCLEHTNELKELDGESFHKIKGETTDSYSLRHVFISFNVLRRQNSRRLKSNS